MARKAIACTVQTRLANGEVSLGRVSNPVDPINGANVTARKTTVASDVATLVADGATPTQAHVNTLNTNWGLLAPDISTYPDNVDVVISYEAANVVTKSTLRLAIEALLARLPETL